ncbi:ATP-binding protein [Bifidobacterium pullorum subsp. saeculare]|uniref:ATP-binding protein n=1 Tax=Bifidobacterium pullorum subsp. saeculare TaxID=78257 RepID=A0A938WXH6_9BIFI|nr:ATP-binding protein [Bifidobacterium pullorum]MBM6699656.1 ATP-binding protein [Bifidobacterium pullorum subsp. saeculare]
MIPRKLADKTRQLAEWFPVVSVTGPRQSGKSTLVRDVFPDYDYLNLEDPQLRKAALDDPVGFIRNRSDRVLIDEVQYAPDLFSMIQVVSDERNTPGQYILSGSQNFLLLKRITQSLAGRVGILRLLPLGYDEAVAVKPELTVDEFMFRGGFPRLHVTGMPTDVFFDAYLSTYVERDAGDYLDVRNLDSFRKFLGLCALNAGNLVNYAKLADGVEVSTATVRSWLSILESSYIAFELMPYHANVRKRLTKTPKLYFHDTGLLCHLLGVRTVSELLVSPYLGMVFENLIVAETLKQHFNEGKTPGLFFYRDDSKIEVDLIDATDPNRIELIEIKSGQTYHDRFARNLGHVGEMLGVPEDSRYVVSRVADSFQGRGARVLSAADWLRAQP